MPQFFFHVIGDAKTTCNQFLRGENPQKDTIATLDGEKNKSVCVLLPLPRETFCFASCLFVSTITHRDFDKTQGKLAHTNKRASPDVTLLPTLILAHNNTYIFKSAPLSHTRISSDSPPSPDSKHLQPHLGGSV